MSVFRVAEIFGPTIQGEGTMIGRPTAFVRFGGCDDRCLWCDSLHAVLPEHRATWRLYSVTDIVGALLRLGLLEGMWVTLSGGNPALHDMEPLIDVLHSHGLKVALETQGTVSQPWFSMLDHLCLSPKPPSSGNVTPLDRIDTCLSVAPPDHVLKVVIFTDGDFDYAQRVFASYPSSPHCLSVGNDNTSPDEPISVTRNRLLDAYAALASRATRECQTARVLPQLHALAWGNARAV